METKANYVLIGAFTILGFLGILLFLMWFAKLQVNRQFAYYDIYFTGCFIVRFERVVAVACSNHFVAFGLQEHQVRFEQIDFVVGPQYYSVFHV